MNEEGELHALARLPGDGMNLASGLVAEIDAEIADRAFQCKAVDDVRCSSVVR